MNNMTIKMKLYLTYGALACVTLIIGITSVLIIRGLGETTTNLSGACTDKLYDAGMVNGDTAELPSLVRAILIRTEFGETNQANAYIADYTHNREDITKKLNEIVSLGEAAPGAALISQLQSQISDTDPLFQSFIAFIHAGDVKGAKAYFEATMLPAVKKVDLVGSDLLEHQKAVMREVNVSAQEEVSRAYWIIMALLVFGIVVGGILVFVIRGLDEQLRQSVLDLTEGSDQVASAATQVSSSSQSLARDTSDQAAMIEETSASAEEINSMAKRNTESSRSASGLVAEAVINTQQTNIAVDECVVAMNQISESSNKIAKTLQVIDKIAFQTNILALNAAVEAARAGEAGMGFAVVAEEVRNLAQRCAAASEEISLLIEQSLGNSDSGRLKMATLVESGAKVNNVFAGLKVLVDEISLSSEEQSRGIEQIGRAIQKMEQGTQKSAANAEESAAAAEELNAQSDQLREVSSSLGAMVGVTTASTSLSVRGPIRKTAPQRISIVPKAHSFTQALKPVAAAAASDDHDFTEF